MIDSIVTMGQNSSPRLLLTYWARPDQEAGQMSVEETISIEGTLLMLDGITPHVAAPVLSDEWGEYQFINLEQGRYQVQCHVLGEYVYYGEGGSTVTDEAMSVFLQVRDRVATILTSASLPSKMGHISWNLAILQLAKMG